jgi:hypothetical protein
MPAARRTSKNAPRRGRYGTLGKETFTQVEKMIADDKIKRAEAFKRLAQQTGRSAGTIATSYYRIARAAGVPLRKGRGAAPRRAAVGGGGVLRAFEAVARLVRDQQKELARLRAENQKYSALRKILNK